MISVRQIRYELSEFAQSRGGRRFLAALAIVLVAAAAMQYRANTYPPDWPAIAKPVKANADVDCPDVSGTYALHPPKATCCGFDQHSTFLAEGLDQEAQTAWETMTVSGVAGRGLTVTFARKAATENGAPITQDVVMPYGARYSCDGGWLVGTRVPVFLYPTQADAMRRRAGTLPSHFRKDAKGALVARVDMRETLTFSPSVAPSLTIPYWSYISPQWAHWLPTAPLTAKSLAPATSAATTTAAPETSMTTVEAWVRADLRDGALPGPLVKLGDSYVFTVYADNHAVIAATVQAMRADAALAGVTLNGTVKNSAGLYEATIKFVLAQTAKRE